MKKKQSNDLYLASVFVSIIMAFFAFFAIRPMEVSEFRVNNTQFPTFFRVNVELSDLFIVNPEQAVLAQKSSFDPNKPMVALTFDDGPSQVTPKILELLKKYNSRATFFVVGNRVGNNAKIIQDICAQGSEVMGHSWSHDYLTKLSESRIRKEFNDTNEAIYRLTGVKPAAARVPYGSVNEKVRKIAREEGLSLISWSIDTRDWQTRNADIIYNIIISSVKDGSIILCHDLHSFTAEAMERVIPELVRQGYQLVTVSELLGATERSLEAGALYSSK
ncbi:MAG: polysaccharide deacetylase family protein [Eubacteriaceae bacterium]|nr:polysaccharide deacetylase family protein [Eubacteriaceae bacterium]